MTFQVRDSIEESFEHFYHSEHIFKHTIGDAYNGFESLLFMLPDGSCNLISYEYGSCDECDPWLKASRKSKEQKMLQELEEEKDRFSTLEEAIEYLRRDYAKPKDLEKLQTLLLPWSDEAVVKWQAIIDDPETPEGLRDKCRNLQNKII